MPERDYHGTQKALWDYMQLYIQGAVQAGKLKTATELAEVVGMAVASATLADPVWMRECMMDAFTNAGSSNPVGWLTGLVAEARENVQVASRRQVDMRVLTDLADEKARKFGLK